MRRRCVLGQSLRRCCRDGAAKLRKSQNQNLLKLFCELSRKASGLFGLGAFIGPAYGSWNYPALSYYYHSGVDAPSAPRLFIECGGERYPAQATGITATLGSPAFSRGRCDPMRASFLRGLKPPIAVILISMKMKASCVLIDPLSDESSAIR